MSKDTQNKPNTSPAAAIPMEELTQRLLDCHEHVHQLVYCHYFYRSVIHSEFSMPDTFARKADWLTGLTRVNGWLEEMGDQTEPGYRPC